MSRRGLTHEPRHKKVLAGTAEFDPAAMCSGDSVQSVSPAPVNFPSRPHHPVSSPA